MVEALELDTQAYSHVNPDILTQFKALLRKYPTAFHLPGAELHPVKGFHHDINTGDSPPVYRMPYRKSPQELTSIKEELRRMLKMHIVKLSHSQWGSPCIFVRKPTKKGVPQPPRFVVDYRSLNKVTVGDGYPIPSVSNILDALSGGQLFGKLDLASSYWQVLVNPRYVHKTAFSTHLGLFEFLRMPYGLITVPQTSQRILNSIFSDFLYNWQMIYIDDLIVWSDNEMAALQHHDKVLQCVTQFGIQFKPTKCVFFSQDLQVLGRHITPTGRFPTTKGTEAISAMPRPKNFSAVKRFLGMVGYFCDYVRDMSNRTKHLHALLRKGIPFKWTSAHDAEFTDLKQALLSPDTMLYHPDWNSAFELHTDASKHGVGAMLAQMHDGQLRPVKFASRSFTPTESRWPTTHQELFAIKWGLEHFHPYVLGRKLKVVTDDANLKFLTSISPQQLKLARWCLSMAEFDSVIQHRPGADHIVPDTLSHTPLLEPSPEGVNLVLPLALISLFLATMLGFDIPSHFPSLVSNVFSYPLDCISLACSPDPANTRAPQPHVEPSIKLFSSQPPKHIPSGETLSHPINIEKVVVIPDQDSHDLRPPNDAVIEPEDEPPENTVQAVVSPVNAELCQVAYEFGKYLNSYLPKQPLLHRHANLFTMHIYLLEKYLIVMASSEALSSHVHIFPRKVPHMEAPICCP